MTFLEVADFLEVTDGTIYRLAAASKILAFKVDGSWRFFRPDIDVRIKQQSTPGLEGSKQGSNEQ